jgi:nitrogen fixation/metabolism regulation signal transduction histidine kinase
VTFRQRLLLTFLALALVPIAVMTLFTLDRLERSLQFWSTPGVQHSLDAALETGKTSLTRMEAVVLSRANSWSAPFPTQRLDAESRRRAQAELRAGGLDFVQLYRRDHGRWRLAGEARPTGVLAVDTTDLSSEVGAALAGDRLVRSGKGALAGVQSLDGGRALVVGMLLSPDYFDKVERVSQGVGFYQRFGVVRDVSRTYTWLLVLALVIALSLAALWASATLARGMTRPLGRLGDAVERVAAGDLGARVRPEGAREVVVLGQRFNAMTERLGAAQEALREAEREAAWREVARRLAHEFKNILTPMSLSLHRLRRRTGEVREEHREAVEESLLALAGGVEQLTRLAEQFSQYARLPEPRFERLDLDRVMRDAVRLHEREEVTLRIQPGDALWVQGDPLLLARAIHNLVLNACEASVAGGVVEVRSLAANGDAVVEVLDRGPGLSPEVRDRLFEPYVSTKRRGSGLGLSLVRDIAAQHHGTIVLEDREGGGARARLSIPRAEPSHDGESLE